MGMLVSVILLVLLFLPQPTAAQMVSAKGLSETERTGLELFLQRCAVCHLGLPARYQTYGPLLHRDLVATVGDAAIREKILKGSQRMPGFQYALRPAEVESIITYLKALKKEDLMRGADQPLQREGGTTPPNTKAPQDGN